MNHEGNQTTAYQTNTPVSIGVSEDETDAPRQPDRAFLSLLNREGVQTLKAKPTFAH